MKNDKKRLREALLEGLLEIVLSLILFGIGALTLRLFGTTLDSPNMDGELILLLGIAFFLVIMGTIVALLQWFKKILGGKHKASKK